jgi:hypothetical protein
MIRYHTSTNDDDGIERVSVSVAPAYISDRATFASAGAY